MTACKHARVALTGLLLAALLTSRSLAAPKQGDTFQTADGLLTVHLLSDTTVEITDREIGGTITCECGVEADRLRVVLNVRGITWPIYYKIRSFGLEDHQGRRLLDQNHSANSTRAPKEALTLPNIAGTSAFQTRSTVLTGRYVTVWNAVLAVLNKQNDKPVQLDQKKGVILTDITAHGWLIPSYEKYAIVLEQLDANSTRMTYKVLRYKQNFEDDGTIRDGSGQKPPAFNERHDHAFEQAVRKRLKARTD